MFGEWLEDLESLEAISQDAEARRIFLHMAAMSQEGRLGSFLVELAGTSELDDFTKGTLSEIAKDEAFPAGRRRLSAPHDGPALEPWPLRRALPPQLTNACTLGTNPIEVVMAREARRTSIGEWAIVDSNHGPPPYQSGALTN